MTASSTSLASMDVASLSRTPWAAPTGDGGAGNESPASIPGNFVQLDALVRKHCAKGTAPPRWMDRVPLRIRIDVVKQGSLMDRYDADEGLWAVIPASAPPARKPNGADNSDSVAQYDVLVDAVERAQGRVLLQDDGCGAQVASVTVEERERIWRAVVDRVNAATAIPAGKKPTPDFMMHLTNMGKDANSCCVVAEHDSVSRIHARVVIGAYCRPVVDGSTNDGQDIVEDTLGVYLEDLGSSNGTFLALLGAESRPSTKFTRLAPRAPTPLAPDTAHMVRLGASSRHYSVTWTPVFSPRTVAGTEGVKRPREAAEPAGRMPPRSEVTLTAGASSGDSDLGGDGAWSAFTAADRLSGASHDQLETRRRQIMAAIADLIRSKVEAGAKARVAALERDLVAVQIAIERRRTDSISGQPGRRARVVAVDDPSLQ
jgi:hypothetical protein